MLLIFLLFYLRLLALLRFPRQAAGRDWVQRDGMGHGGTGGGERWAKWERVWQDKQWIEARRDNQQTKRGWQQIVGRSETRRNGANIGQGRASGWGMGRLPRIGKKNSGKD